MSNYASWEIASKANKWQGRNIERWRHDEYDRLWRSAETEMDPIKRTALFIRMNDLVVQHVVCVPFFWRNLVTGISHRLKGPDISPWDSNLWHLAYWYREG
jgi:peptide/nickel transport system substrate-binding protein